MPLDPQARTVLDALTSLRFPDLWRTTGPEFRALARELRAPAPVVPVERVEDRSVAGPAGPIPLRLYWPRGAAAGPLPALVYFHGGGFVIGDLDSHDGTCRELANAAGCLVASVDYRLAPEARFPAAADDCSAATRWLARSAAAPGVDAARIGVGGRARDAVAEAAGELARAFAR